MQTQISFTHTHMNTQTHIHTYTHTRIYTYMHACMHACMHTYIHTYIHTHTHIHTVELITSTHTYVTVCLLLVLRTGRGPPGEGLGPGPVIPKKYCETRARAQFC